MQQIKEIIVVEGRDDTQAVKRAVPCQTIETHGFGISAATWEKLESAYRTNGLIVLTDPDHAGEEIRRRISERFPDAGHAYLPRRDASAKDGDIGVENASPEAIREALSKVNHSLVEAESSFSEEDLLRYSLSGGEGSRERREAIGKALGIGYGNAKALLEKLNRYGISREDFEEAANMAALSSKTKQG